MIPCLQHCVRSRIGKGHIYCDDVVYFELLIQLHLGAQFIVGAEFSAPVFP